MQPLEPPDTHRLLAAAGWLELGCPTDALAELDAMSAPNQQHPDSLELRCLVQSQQQDWPAALHSASQLVDVAPERSTGWLQRAYAMRRTPDGGLEKAWDLLRPAAAKFPKEFLIPYNLACYACQLGQLDEARQWFTRALQHGQTEVIKTMALKDADLQPLWSEIKTMKA